jgi:hypothetical protein
MVTACAQAIEKLCQLRTRGARQWSDTTAKFADRRMLQIEFFPRNRHSAHLKNAGPVENHARRSFTTAAAMNFLSNEVENIVV